MSTNRVLSLYRHACTGGAGLSLSASTAALLLALGSSLGADRSRNRRSSANVPNRSRTPSASLGIPPATVRASRAAVSSCESPVVSPSVDPDLGPNPPRRTRRTNADLHFVRRGEIPRPGVMHAVLPDRRGRERDGLDGGGSAARKGVLIAGDVHGCLDELLALVKSAEEANEGAPFRAVILVGDLCNKGPRSAAVVRYVRAARDWFAVRGNHDDGALAAALGDEERRRKKKYRWVVEGGDAGDDRAGDGSRSGETALSDDDVMWLSELPYTITIPRSYFSDDEVGAALDRCADEADTIVVHAGLVPGVPLEEQTVETMITLREVSPHHPPRKGEERSDEAVTFTPYQRKKARASTELESGCANDDDDDSVRGDPVPWASVWRGPQRVVFGHDARRGLQRYDGDWAIGLDTGACYGKRLTGLVLPGRKIVSVEAFGIHCRKWVKSESLHAATCAASPP